MNGKNILVMRKHQLVCIINIHFQQRAVSGYDVLIGYRQLGEYDRRNIAAFVDRIRIENKDTATGTEKHTPFGSQRRGRLTETHRKSNAAFIKTLEAFFRRTELAKPVLSTDP